MKHVTIFKMLYFFLFYSFNYCKNIVQTGWSDVGLSGTSPTPYSDRNPASRYSVTSNVYVLRCYFQLSSSSMGAAIYLLSWDSSYQMLAEKSTFNKCISSSSYGGAIYMSTSGSFVLNECCGYSCYLSDSFGQGQFVYTEAGSTGINKILSSSIIYSNPPIDSDSNQQSTFKLQYGKMTIQHDNFSFNSCDSYAGIHCSAGSGSSMLIEYVWVCNNTASTYECIDLSGDSTASSSYIIQYCNINGNKITNSNDYGLIYISCQTTIKSTSILENDDDIIFYATASLSIVNCSIVESDLQKIKITYTGQINTANWKPSSLFLNKIEFDETYLCSAYIYQDLTPTKEKKVYTFKGDFYNRRPNSDILRM